MSHSLSVCIFLSPSMKWDHTVILFKGASKDSTVCDPVSQQAKSPKSISS